MTDAAEARHDPGVLPDLLPTCGRALAAAEGFQARAKGAVAGLVAPGGRVDGALLEREQFAAHGFAWLATYVAALRESLHWAQRLEAAGRLRELEGLRGSNAPLPSLKRTRRLVP